LDGEGKGREYREKAGWERARGKGREVIGKG